MQVDRCSVRRVVPHLLQRRRSNDTRRVSLGCEGNGNEGLPDADGVAQKRSAKLTKRRSDSRQRFNLMVGELYLAKPRVFSRQPQKITRDCSANFRRRDDQERCVQLSSASTLDLRILNARSAASSRSCC